MRKSKQRWQVVEPELHNKTQTKKKTQWCLLLWMTAIINRWAAHTGHLNTTCCAKGGHGIKMPDWTMGGSKEIQCRHMKTHQATRAVSKVECETGRSGLGSYLLLFVGLGPPTKWTSPTSIDRDQVLPNALFTVQFNHILEGRTPLAPQQSQQRYFRDRFAIIWTMSKFLLFCLCTSQKLIWSKNHDVTEV